MYHANDDEIAIPDYSILCNDRNRHDGGVAILFKSSISVTLIHSGHKSQLESLWLSLSGGSIPPSTALCACYRPSACVLLLASCSLSVRSC